MRWRAARATMRPWLPMSIASRRRRTVSWASVSPELRASHPRSTTERQYSAGSLPRCWLAKRRTVASLEVMVSAPVAVRRWGRNIVGEWRPQTLRGVDVALPAHVMEVDQKLGGVADASDGVEGVAVAQGREERDGVEFVEMGAGHREEVHDHQVGVPGLDQVGQAVEHVEGAETLGGCKQVDRVAKLSKPSVGSTSCTWMSLTSSISGGCEAKRT